MLLDGQVQATDMQSEPSLNTTAATTTFTMVGRFLEETLQQIDAQLSMLQDEMEEMLANPEENNDDWVKNRVQEQMNQTKAARAAFLASRNNETASAIEEAAYEETEDELLKEKEDEAFLEEEETYYRYGLLVFFVLVGVAVHRSRNQGRRIVSTQYRTVPTDHGNDERANGIEMGTR